MEVWASAFAAAQALLAAGCLQPDPNHCANWGPERRCAPETTCSRCTAERNGCVPPPVAATCLVAQESSSSFDAGDGGDAGDTAGDGPGTTEVLTATTTEASVSATTTDASTSTLTTDPTSEDTSSSTGTTTTGPSPECAVEGADPTCPVERPFCIAGRCAPCTDDPTLACPGERCHPNGMSCVQCLEETDCAATDGCLDDYTCGGCTRHEQCPDSACDIDRRTCIDPNNVVDVEDCTTSGGPPYCTIADARAANTSISPLVIRLGSNVRSSAYVERIELVARTLAIIGSGNATIDGSNDEGNEAIEISNTARLYLSNLRLRSAPAGIRCTGSARLYLDRVRIDDIRGTALEADACAHLQLRESQVLGNDGSALVASGGSHVVVHSSVIGCNGSLTESTRALSFGDSTFDIRASTIAANRAAALAFDFPAPANLECSAASGLVRNSVLLSPEGRSIDCPEATFSGTLLDDDVLSDPDEDVHSIEWNPDWFEDPDGLCDLRLADDVREPFADVATWELGDPRYDLDGAAKVPTPVPYPGQRLFAGAHQP